jgi:hypothetical protein
MTPSGRGAPWATGATGHATTLAAGGARPPLVGAGQPLVGAGQPLVGARSP